MRTKGQAIKDKINDSSKEIDRLLTVSHTEEDYANLFKIIGGEIEKYLKSSVFQTTARKDFYRLIEDLKTLGISQTYIDNLHHFRETYNSYKHQPGFSKSILEARKIFEDVAAAINDVNGKGPGLVNSPYNEKSKRVVWFAGWDDYIGGMVECNIFLPDYSVDFPWAIEHFNITFDGWDQVVKMFTFRGDLKMGKQFVSEKAYNVWSANVDLAGVGVFDGDVTEFIHELAKHVSPGEKGLLSFLKRENDSTSVKAAITFSLFDSLRSDSWTNEEDLKNEILLRASYDYGISLDSHALSSCINQIDYRAIDTHRSSLSKIAEITWTDKVGFVKLNTIVLSTKMEIGLSANGKLLAVVQQ